MVDISELNNWLELAAVIGGVIWGAGRLQGVFKCMHDTAARLDNAIDRLDKAVVALEERLRSLENKVSRIEGEMKD